MKSAVRAVLFSIPLSFALTKSAQADCKERVDKVRDEIERDKDKYTRESRTEANRHLVQATLPSLNPMQCAEHISKARKALREGKQ